MSTGSWETSSPGSSERWLHVVLQRQGHLEQRVVRGGANGVQQLDQVLERDVLVVVCGEADLSNPVDATRSRLGSPLVSTRATQVLTKKPTSRLSASSVRPAIGDPIGMSSPAPSR